MKFPWFIPLGIVAGLTLTWAFFGYVVGDWNSWDWHWFTRLAQGVIGVVGGLIVGFLIELGR